MANKYFTQLTQLTAGNLADADAFAVEDITASETKYITATNVRSYMTGGGSFFLGASGRLTTESGVPVSSSDRTAQASIYLTPYQGNWMPLYDGSSFTITTFAELTLSLNATPHVSGSVYDIFYFDNSGTKTIATGPAWSSTSARGTGAGTTELELYSGIYVNKNIITLKNGASTYSNIAARQATYIGTFYATANGQTQDANYGRCLWNYYNRVGRIVYTQESTSHTYTTGSWRSWNSNTTVGQARAQFVIGLLEDSYDISAGWGYTSVSSGFNVVGVGVNSTSSANITQSFPVISTVNCSVHGGAHFFGLVNIGYNYAQLLEYGSATSHTLTSGAMYLNIKQ